MCKGCLCTRGVSAMILRVLDTDSLTVTLTVLDKVLQCLQCIYQAIVDV